MFSRYHILLYFKNKTGRQIFEIFLVNQTCPEDYFECGTLEMCIPSLWRCDGDNDCYDKSDEVSRFDLIIAVPMSKSVIFSLSLKRSIALYHLAVRHTSSAVMAVAFRRIGAATLITTAMTAATKLIAVSDGNFVYFSCRIEMKMARSIGTLVTNPHPTHREGG